MSSGRSSTRSWTRSCYSPTGDRARPRLRSGPSLRVVWKPLLGVEQGQAPLGANDVPPQTVLQRGLGDPAPALGVSDGVEASVPEVADRVVHEVEVRRDRSLVVVPRVP